MKKGPLIFITILVITLIFILGMQYGKRVEQANKTISYILSITPPLSPTAQAKAPLRFEEYIHTGCGITFTAPVGYSESKESSTGAILLYEEHEQSISFECVPSITPVIEDKSATTEVRISNTAVNGYVQGSQVTFIATNPLKRLPVVVTVDTALLELISTTIQFIK